MDMQVDTAAYDF